MKIFIKIVCIALIAVFVSSCCACRRTPQKTQAPLMGTQWQLVQLDGLSVQPKAGEFTIQFSADKRITGIGECNRLTGTFTTDPTRAIHFSMPAMTRKACPDMNTETEFVKMFGEITHYSMDGKMLLLLENGNVRAIFQ